MPPYDSHAPAASTPQPRDLTTEEVLANEANDATRELADTMQATIAHCDVLIANYEEARAHLAAACGATEARRNAAQAAVDAIFGPKTAAADPHLHQMRGELGGMVNR